MVQESVGAARRRQSTAHHPEVLRGASLPEGAGSGARRARPARLIAQGLWLRGPQRHQLRADLSGARARRLRHPQLRLGAVLALHVSDPCLRLRGAEAEVPSGHGARGAHRLLRAHRAARRLRPRQHEDPCQAARQGLGAERLEDVDHQRRHRRPRGRLGHDGGRNPWLHRRERHSRLRRTRDRAEVLPARLGHLRPVLRQCSRAGGATCCPASLA